MSQKDSKDIIKLKIRVPHSVFVCSRKYSLTAPSQEAMRIWVDVLFTGAEGYQEFQDLD